MEDPHTQIIKFLEKNNIPYELIDHEPVYTSEEATKVRWISLHQGAKTLLLKAKDAYMLFILPGDMKLDTKRVKTLLAIKDLRFATPEEVKMIMGCEVEACYPFGNLINIRMFVDKSLAQNEMISFNPGVHTKSIKMM